MKPSLSEISCTADGFRGWKRIATECVGQLFPKPGAKTHNHTNTTRDAVTPNQDFIISPHPRSQNLFIAGGGSFHGWKFLPNIGSYVVQMLTGKLPAEMAQKWAWDRSDEGGAYAPYQPSRDIKEIAGYSEMNAGSAAFTGT